MKRFELGRQMMSVLCRATILCTAVILLVPTGTGAQEECYRVWERTLPPPASRMDWLTVASSPPRGYHARPGAGGGACMTFAQAQAMMDTIRTTDRGFRDVCKKYQLWVDRTTTPVQRTMRDPNAVGLPPVGFVYEGSCGCAESCAWAVDPEGQFANTDSRTVELGDGRVMVIGRDGRVAAGPISPPATQPGGPLEGYDPRADLPTPQGTKEQVDIAGAQDVGPPVMPGEQASTPQALGGGQVAGQQHQEEPADQGPKAPLPPGPAPGSAWLKDDSSVRVPHETLIPMVKKEEEKPGRPGTPTPSSGPSTSGPLPGKVKADITPTQSSTPTGCPLCREMTRINCESISPGNPTCKTAGASCQKCPSGADYSLANVKKQCFIGMNARLKNAQKAERICRCNPGSGAACTGPWSASRRMSPPSDPGSGGSAGGAGSFN